jgi:hypothetical protein
MLIKKPHYLILLALGILYQSTSFAVKINTNEVQINNAPSWLTSSKVNSTVDKIQNALEWSIRKVNVVWYYDQDSFQKYHGYNPTVLAVTKKDENTIHMGPRIDTSNFSQVFGHELVHIILFQKYKNAIPQWLEEGLANYTAKQGKVDYLWLASQSNRDIRSLIHPFINSGNATKIDARYHYQASTAAIEMIASQCRLSDILQLSVGEKLENYLSTYCRITDINSEFQKWIKRRSQR